MTKSVEKPSDPSLFVIWHRSRTRAFAHEIAAQRLQKQADREYTREMVSAIVGISLLVAGLSLSDGAIGNAFQALITDIFPSASESLERDFANLVAKGLVALSALVSMFSLGISVLSKRTHLISLQGKHKLVSRLYMSISQKTRRMESGIFDESYRKYLIHFLNDYIETIFSSGDNPSDEDYQAAHYLVGKILIDPTPGVADSFKPDIPGETFDLSITHLPEPEPSNDSKDDKDRCLIGRFWKRLRPS